jgi:hypothetical protein
MRFILLALALLATPAFAEDIKLNFDTAKLCEWQNKNNSMDIAECTKLEDEAKTSVADLEPKADAKRKQDCLIEGSKFSVDSGFASYTLYSTCLKDGPGSL